MWLCGRTRQAERDNRFLGVQHRIKRSTVEGRVARNIIGRVITP